MCLCIIHFSILAQPGDSSDLHPLREIASVIMTSSGFISPAREGRMADAKTPVVSRLATNNLNLLESGTGGSGGSGASSSDHTKTPQGPSKAKPSKPADETSDEGLIEDSDDDFKTSIAPEQPTPPTKSTGNTISFILNHFQV